MNGKLYGDVAGFPGRFNGCIQPSWNDFKNLGKKGMLVVATHGRAGAFVVAAGKTEAQLRTYIGLPAISVPGVDDEPPGVDIIQNGLYSNFGNDYLLIVDYSWIANNWRSDRDNARSIGLFMACHTAEKPSSGSSIISYAGGAEAFGYTWCCMSSDHVHDVGLLLGQRMNSAIYRPAGIAMEAGGYTDRMSSCSPFDPETEKALRFVRSSAGDYWTTLNPAPFLKADASATSTSSGNCVGYAAVHLDTQRDTSFPPQAVLTQESGTGQIVIGPYNVQPSWGIGCEYRLRPGQQIKLYLDNTQVVGDGSTKKLKLAAPMSWNAGN